ncbi:hypothetical protein [Specibacter sp. RAF43]
MNQHTARAVQSTVQFIFYTLVAACMFVGPALLASAIFPSVAA